jgi:RimJ/RimL family protein N-acetyltransferase
MRQIVASNPDHLKFLCDKIEYVPTVNMRGITLLSDGEPVLIVGYDGWTEGSVVMHQWAKEPRYFGRDILRAAFQYPFGAGLQVVFGQVRSDNPAALEADRKIGFSTVAVIPDAYGPGVDMHFLQLRRENCRWYNASR